jgi:hypothetical protein
MYKTIKEYVETLNDEVILKIIKDYEQFESEGAIGDCALRSNAQEVGFNLGIGDHMIVCTMEKLTFECYRHFAHRMISAS